MKIKSIYTLALLSSIFLFSCSSGEKESADGWKNLFNGEDLSGEDVLTCLETVLFILGRDPVLTSLRDKLRLSPKLFSSD